MNVKLFCKRNASTILTCMGGVGVVATSVLAVKATPKALSLLEQAKEEKGEDLTKLEIVKVAWKPYIPTFLMCTGTLACVFGAHTLSKRQQAALMSAYAMLDSSYKEYKVKTQELYGEEADTAIRNAIAQDHYDGEDSVEEDDGKQLFYDEFSKRYFRATSETVLRAEYELNKIVAEDCYATLNELYDLFGLPHVDYGDTVGWSSVMLCEMYWSNWVDFWHESGELEDGTKFYRIDFTEPIPDFENY